MSKPVYEISERWHRTSKCCQLNCQEFVYGDTDSMIGKKVFCKNHYDIKMFFVQWAEMVRAVEKLDLQFPQDEDEADDDLEVKERISWRFKERPLQDLRCKTEEIE